MENITVIPWQLILLVNLWKFAWFLRAHPQNLGFYSQWSPSFSLSPLSPLSPSRYPPPPPLTCYKSQTTTVSRNVRIMYDLVRSPCLGISDYASVLLHFIFGNAKKYLLLFAFSSVSPLNITISK